MWPNLFQVSFIVFECPRMCCIQLSCDDGSGGGGGGGGGGECCLVKQC